MSRRFASEGPSLARTRGGSGLAAARLQYARHEEAARILEARQDSLLVRSLAEGQELAVTVAASLAIGLASLGLILQAVG